MYNCACNEKAKHSCTTYILKRFFVSNIAFTLANVDFAYEGCLLLLVVYEAIKNEVLSAHKPPN